MRVLDKNTSHPKKHAYLVSVPVLSLLQLLAVAGLHLNWSLLLYKRYWWLFGWGCARYVLPRQLTHRKETGRWLYLVIQLTKLKSFYANSPRLM